MTPDMIRGMGFMLMLYGAASFCSAMLRWYLSRPKKSDRRK